VNAKYLIIYIPRNGNFIPYHLVRLKDSDRIDVYMDFVYLDVLRKRFGVWFISGLEELAQVIGEKLEKEPGFLDDGFWRENIE